MRALNGRQFSLYRPDPAPRVEHQGRRPPDVDVRYHEMKAYERTIQKKLTEAADPRERTRARAVEHRRS